MYLDLYLARPYPSDTNDNPRLVWPMYAILHRSDIILCSHQSIPGSDFPARFNVHFPPKSGHWPDTMLNGR